MAFLDVGQGDAIQVTTPSARQVLVDDGPDGPAVLNAIGHRMPFSDRDLDLAVLKVAHHGSKNGTTARFLQAVAPAIVVISVGSDNNFGHPAPEVLARLGGTRVCRTDRDETIELISDGRRLWVNTV